MGRIISDDSEDNIRLQGRKCPIEGTISDSSEDNIRH